MPIADYQRYVQHRITLVSLDSTTENQQKMQTLAWTLDFRSNFSRYINISVNKNSKKRALKKEDTVHFDRQKTKILTFTKNICTLYFTSSLFTYAEDHNSCLVFKITTVTHLEVAVHPHDQ
jgi:hypothetical protein